MLEKLMRLYVMSMAGDVRSPLPHLFGPPGCGKSTVAKQLAALVEKKLHIINVSRISPLELEGVQMPHALDGEELKLKLLHATFWTQIEEGDVLLFDEFLRGFPEVYNGLLDILTSREVGGMQIPRAFFMAASNSVISYDRALADRLLHIPVGDPRKKKSENKRLAQLLIDEIGLIPSMLDSMEMQDLLQTEVWPMFSVLDQLKNGGMSSGGGAPTQEGRSIRNLIGQAKLREIQSTNLQELIDMNNINAANSKKYQYVVLTDGKKIPVGYVENTEKLKALKPGALSPIQALNLELNLQLIGLEAIRNEKEDGDDLDTDDIFSS